MNIELTWEEETDDRERLNHGTRWYLKGGSFILGLVSQDTINVPFSPPHLWRRWEAKLMHGNLVGNFLTESEAKDSLFRRVVEELKATPDTSDDS
jgi:hypothetical protein